MRRIDLHVRGLDRGKGRSRDRLQVSAADAVYQTRKAMLVDLATRIGGLELLRALYDHRFTLEELYVAYAGGTEALAALLSRKQSPPLETLIDDYIRQDRSRTKTETRQRLTRFLSHLGETAELSDLTSGDVEGFLEELTTLRGKTAREASAATKNRYLMALKGFGTWLVEQNYLDTHPVKGVKEYFEGARRVRYLTPEEYRAYFQALAADRPGLVPVFKVLAHTGADVSEVVSVKMKDGTMSQPFTVRDFHAARDLPRILFKRTKVTESPERLVPVTQEVHDLLIARIDEGKLSLSDPMFGDVTGEQLRYAHVRARDAIGRPDLRRKDLRHVAAVLWRWAGVDLDRIREWLGHSDIGQTAVYAAFGALDSFDAPAIRRVETILAEKPGESTQEAA